MHGSVGGVGGGVCWRGGEGGGRSADYLAYPHLRPAPGEADDGALLSANFNQRKQDVYEMRPRASRSKKKLDCRYHYRDKYMGLRLY